MEKQCRELEAPNLMKTKKSKLKNEFKNYFHPPIDSFIKFLPYFFWENHLKESQLDGQCSLQTKRKWGRFLSHIIHKFKSIRIEELFQFYAIMIQAIIKPTPGNKIIER